MPNIAMADGCGNIISPWEKKPDLAPRREKKG